MVNVDIDETLYADIKEKVKERKFEYPSIKFFVQRAICNELLGTKNSSDKDFERFYSRLKEAIKNNPDFKSKLDEAYSAEIKKIKEGISR